MASVANEERIINDRLTTSEVNYKRVLRACSALANGTEDTDNLRSQLEAEFAQFEIMLSRLQLQVDMNRDEMGRYEELAQSSKNEASELSSRTRELQEQLVEAQVIRKQKEEINEFVEAMIKPKKAFVPKAELYVNSSDTEGTHPIIALLNLSRSESVKVNTTIEEEIEVLESQRDRYQRLWDVRREHFDEMMASIKRSRDEILRIGAEDDEMGQETPESVEAVGGDVEMSDVQTEAEA